MIRCIPSSLRLISILIFVCLLVSHSQTAKAQVSVTDSLTLVDLYNSTHGQSWTFDFNWLAGGPVGSWFGVQVQGGRVTGLSLNANNLTGSIPTSLGNLDGLQFLFLIGNQLNGSIPDEFGQLVNLELLFLFANQLSGEIPENIINCQQLQNISLNNNLLTGKIPTEIGQMSALTSIDFSSNNLSGGIPKSIEFLSNLEQFNVSSNNLDGEIADELGRCYDLVSINLDDNQFTGSIPDNFQFLESLQGLSIRNNALNMEMPSFIGQLASLQVLYLENNNLFGSIPASIGQLDNLLFLHLQGNELSGTLPEELGGMESIRKIDLSGNNVTGSIPASLGNLSTLETLWLQDNLLTNQVPWELALASNLESLILDNNNLRDGFPLAFASASNLKYLSFINNDIDDLPDLSGISGLSTLRVENNKLTFEDLEANMNINGSVTYIPQQDVYQEEYLEIELGGDISIESSIGGSQNEYQWLRNGFILAGENSGQFSKGGLQFNDAGDYWAAITSPLVPNLTISRNPVSVEISSPLPVELTRFDAQLVQDQVQLDWETESEFNNAYFEVQRSKDGETFEVTDRINGAGTSQVPMQYRAFDFEPYVGVSYYRLRQVDFDGTDSYSEVRVIRNKTTFDMLAYPSPVSQGQLITVLINMTGNLQIRLYDSQSRLIQKRGMWHQSGELIIDISTATLSPGHYLIVVDNAEESRSQKVVVHK